MDIFILVCDVFLPIIISLMGVLYIINFAEKIDKVFIFILSIAIFVSGVSGSHKEYEDRDKKVLINKKTGMIWICGGLFMLVITILALALNRIEGKGIQLLEVECMLIVMILITIECFFKRN